MTSVPVTKRTSCRGRGLKIVLGNVLLVTVVISLGGCVRHDDLHAGVGSVVGSLALFAVAVSHIVRILFVKLG